MQFLQTFWLRDKAGSMAYFDKKSYATADAVRIGRVHTFMPGMSLQLQLQFRHCLRHVQHQGVVLTALPPILSLLHLETPKMRFIAAAISSKSLDATLHDNLLFINMLHCHAIIDSPSNVPRMARCYSGIHEERWLQGLAEDQGSEAGHSGRLGRQGRDFRP